MKLATAIVLLVAITAGAQTRTTQPTMARWTGKYPDAKFFTQPQIKTPLRRILTKGEAHRKFSTKKLVP